MTVTVRARITNTGTVRGAEVVQVYVGDPESVVLRPERELKGFVKVALEPGESREVEVVLDARDLSYWHPTLRAWTLEGGEFLVSVGASSRDLRATVSVDVTAPPLAAPLSDDSTFGEWLDHPVGGELLRAELARPETAGADDQGNLELDETMAKMLLDMPVRVIANFAGMLFDRDGLARLLDQAQERSVRA